MKDYIRERTIEEANYLIRTQGTVRDTATAFGVSKSTTHLDLDMRLQKINPSLYDQVRNVLDYNKEVRHLRGGIATKNVYLSRHTYL